MGHAERGFTSARNNELCLQKRDRLSTLINKRSPTVHSSACKELKEWYGLLVPGGRVISWRSREDFSGELARTLKAGCSGGTW